MPDMQNPLPPGFGGARGAMFNAIFGKRRRVETPAQTGPRPDLRESLHNTMRDFGMEMFKGKLRVLRNIAIGVGAVAALGYTADTAIHAWQDHHAYVEEKAGLQDRDFVLHAQDGSTLSQKDLAGKYVMVTFGIAEAGSESQAQLQKMEAVYNALPANVRDKVVPLFISLDPVRDTPERIGDFTAAYAPHVMGATGDTRSLYAFTKPFGIAYRPLSPGQDGVRRAGISPFIAMAAPDGKMVTIRDSRDDAREIARNIGNTLQARTGNLPANMYKPFVVESLKRK